MVRDASSVLVKAATWFRPCLKTEDYIGQKRCGIKQQRHETARNVTEEMALSFSKPSFFVAELLKFVPESSKQGFFPLLGYLIPKLKYFVLNFIFSG